MITNSKLSLAQGFRSGAEDNRTPWAYRCDARWDEDALKQEHDTLEALRKARRNAARQAQAEVAASADDAEETETELPTGVSHRT